MSIQEARRAAFEKWFADQKKHNDLLLDRISIECVWAGASPETLGEYQHQARDAWNAWNAALDSVVEREAKEQEEFLAHLADFEPEDTFHG